MLNGDILIAEVPSSWKHGFNNGVIIPQKWRFCSDCKTDSTLSESEQLTLLKRDRFDKPINQTKEFSANLKELKDKLQFWLAICALGVLII